jgi:hypothetical protein
MDDDIYRKTLLDKKNFSLPIFQAVSNVPKEIVFRISPTEIVLGKYGIMRLHWGFSTLWAEKFHSD